MVRNLHLFAKQLVAVFPDVKAFKNEADKTVTVCNSPIEMAYQRVWVLKAEAQNLFA